ncbi:MAG: alpha/beta fold hydrolase [Acidimicrobiia bacterium]|nr:alpha/beta fold hydrolase [Acidimicrobiia bacterium]
MNRREFLQVGTTVAAASYARATHASPLPQEGSTPGTSRFFPAGFTVSDVQTTGTTIDGARGTIQVAGTTIRVVKGGEGPPLLLLHGAPMTHITWRLIAPQLAKSYTVVAADLRGYGDSGKPPDSDEHANYSKRIMARDQVEVMRHFGFTRFPVVGHDRGGRVGHRMALDYPDAVTRLAVLDILPTHYLYTHVTMDFVRAYFHWFNYLREAPGPENELKVQYDGQLARATTDAQKEFARAMSNPATIHAMCEDYRAAASIDLRHDEADLKAGRKVTCPLTTIWGERGAMGRLYDVLSIWRDYATRVTGKGLPAGHNLQEEAPEPVLAEVMAFLRA